jgi:hypothetical protein
MAEVIELSQGEEPREHERYAPVFVSSEPAMKRAAIALHDCELAFLACDKDHAVGVIVGRAKSWADANIVATVYARRDAH